jgi:hypothetical protein
MNKASLIYLNIELKIKPKVSFIFTRGFLKWTRCRRVICLEIQVGITNQRNKWADTDPGNTGGGIRCLEGVSIP